MSVILKPDAAASGAPLLDALRELVEAIDRRVPHLERAGERAIARDALALRADALKRLAELEQPR
jgi:hypothetical protein